MARFYLSGPMSGLEDYNRPAFHATAQALREQGHEVINPAELLGEDDENMTWPAFLARDLRIILTDEGLDALVMLTGWRQSKGARLEAFTATTVEIPLLDYPALKRVDFCPCAEHVITEDERAEAVQARSDD